MVTILTQAFRRTQQNWQLVLLIFLINFIFGLIIAFPTFSALKADANHSLAYNKLIRDFDFSVFIDFFNQKHPSFFKLVPIGLGLTLLYSLLNVFFAGGILSKFTERDSFQLSSFLRNSAKYFLPFLLLFLLSFLLLVFLTIVSISILMFFARLSEGKTEPQAFLRMLPAIIFSFFLITYALNVSYYAKVILHRDNLLNPLKAFWKSMVYVFANFKTMKIYWATFLVSLLLLGFYWLIDLLIGMQSGFTIWLMFLVQQFFVFCRIFVHTWNLSNAFDYVSLRPIPLTPVPQIISPTLTEPSTEDLTNVQIEEQINPISPIVSETNIEENLPTIKIDEPINPSLEQKN